MNIIYFFKIYPPKRLYRMFWLSVAKLPMLPTFRAKILKLGGVKISGRCFVYSNVLIDSVAPERIHISEGVTITSGTKILTHYYDPSQKGRHFRIGDVYIEKDVFIGLNVLICNNITIGEGAVIGAGSIVTKNILPYQIWAGNPAKFIKERVC